MLYSFLSESGVLDISLLALGTGIIVLSILGLLHLGKLVFTVEFFITFPEEFTT